MGVGLITLHELSRYYRLRERLERNEQILESLRATAHPGAQRLTGMPHSPGVKDKVGDLAVEIADMQEQIRFLQQKIDSVEIEVTAYINAVEDDHMRTILRLRFLRCLTWAEVAWVIGGRNTEEGVKSACYRFLPSESCNGVTPGDAC